MAGYEISRVGDSIDQLGESLVWDERRQCLFWADAIPGLMHCLDFATGARRDMQLPWSIGALALCASGGMVASLADGFYKVDLETGAASPASPRLNADPSLRFNDGCVDPQGRFLSGMMHIRPPADGVGRGEVWRLEAGGEAARIGRGFLVFNGPCFSPDGGRLYFTDSPTRRIMVCEYDAATGDLGGARAFVDLAPLSTRADGATVDAEGCLWSVLIGSSQVARFDPEGGLMLSLDMPVSLPADICFGGPALDVIFVTSISRTPNVTASEPGAGGLYRIDGLGVKGRPEARFSG